MSGNTGKTRCYPSGAYGHTHRPSTTLNCIRIFSLEISSVSRQRAWYTAPSDVLSITGPEFHMDNFEKMNEAQWENVKTKDTERREKSKNRIV